MLTERGLRRPATLSDGTPFSDLINLDTREVSMRLLSDPEIYELELERLFTKAWIVVAHESEIPNPGDFVTRYIGGDPVIVIRGDSGDIQILLNVCSHRGAIVCRPEIGNASQLRCIYHGWTFDRQGRFLAAPATREQMHGDILPKSALGLTRARVSEYAGMVFGTFDADAPSLDDFLGDIKYYLDLMWTRTNEGMEVIGPAQHYTIEANWKCAGEQFAGDAVHTLMLHRSLLELGIVGEDLTFDAAPGMYGIDVGTRQGHGVRCIPLRDTYRMLFGEASKSLSTRQMLEAVPPPGISPAMLDQLEARFDAGQLRMLAEAPPQVGGLFPNIAILNMPFPTPDGQWSASTSWHTFAPTSPTTFEFYNWVLVERGATEEHRKAVRRATIQSVGSSGTIEQDDSEVWPGMTRASRGPMARRQTLKYQALLGENRPADWPGGGLVYEGFSKDDNQWNWWKHYFDYMTAEAG